MYISNIAYRLIIKTVIKIARNLFSVYIIYKGCLKFKVLVQMIFLHMQFFNIFFIEINIHEYI